MALPLPFFKVFERNWSASCILGSNLTLSRIGLSSNRIFKLCACVCNSGAFYIWVDTGCQDR